MEPQFSLLHLIIFFSTLITLSKSQPTELCNPNDKNALLQIKNQLGPTAQIFSNWLPTTDCCKTWVNIGCNTQTGRVNILTIGGGELSGQIPPVVGQLTGLETLWFNDMPGLTGPIPSSISNLVNLRDLELTRTNLSGLIPAFLGRLVKLSTLDLSENRLAGPIPGSLSLLSNLTQLKLFKNQLTGSIPESFGSFRKLGLQAQENRLLGPIPASLGRAGFTLVELSKNRLTGDASVLFGRRKRLVLVNLNDNALSFDFSKVELNSGLMGLDLSHNMIYGSLPNGLAQLRSLQLFNVSYNQLCGPIPAGNWVRSFGPDAFDHNKCLCGAPLAACN